MNLKITPITYAIYNVKESPIFGDNTIHIKAQDDAGGLFFIVENISPEVDNDHIGNGKIPLELEELEALLEIARMMTDEFKKEI
jgi:hypothetical protein